MQPGISFGATALADLVAQLSQDDTGTTRGGPVRCSAANPTGYSSPSDHTLETGDGTIANKIGTRFGRSGTVVPRATVFGASSGHTIRNPKSLIVNIDPDKKNSITVDLAQLSKQATTQAMSQVRAVAGDPATLEDFRTQAFAGMVVASQAIGAPAQPAAEPVVQRNASQPVAAQPTAQPGRLLQSFSQPPGQPPQTRLAAAAAPQPQRRVTFDFGPPIGLFPCQFDSAVVQRDANGSPEFLILGLSEANQGSFLPSDVQAEFAVDVLGEDQIFLVESTGIKFTHAGETLCVLGISRAQSR